MDNFANIIIDFQNKWDLNHDECATLWNVSTRNVERWVNQETTPRKIILNHVLTEIELYEEIIDSVKNNIHYNVSKNGQRIGHDLNIVEIAKICGYGHDTPRLYQRWWNDKPHQILHRLLALYIMEKMKNE